MTTDKHVTVLLLTGLLFAVLHLCHCFPIFIVCDNVLGFSECASSGIVLCLVHFIETQDEGVPAALPFSQRFRFLVRIHCTEPAKWSRNYLLYAVVIELINLQLAF